MNSALAEAPNTVRPPPLCFHSLPPVLSVHSKPLGLMRPGASFVAAAPLARAPPRRHRPLVSAPRCSSASGGGRGSEFSVSGPLPPSGIQWKQWVANRGEKAPMPLLPFQPHEVLLPGEEKTLHLFEARYLALFDEVVLNYDQRFGHVLLSQERASLAASGTLVRVSEWERMDIGVKLRVHGVGRILVSAVEQGTTAPYFLGSVSFVSDSDLAEEESESPLDALIEQEEQFWKLAMRLIDLSVDLSVAPFRSKKHFAPPTLPGDKFGLTSLPPPPDEMDDAAKKVVYLDQLRQAVERGSWPLCGGNDGGELTKQQKEHFRLKAVSFAGFELFPSDAGMRQRALELRSTAERFERVLAAVEGRTKAMEAKLALRKAFPSL